MDVLRSVKSVFDEIKRMFYEAKFVLLYGIFSTAVIFCLPNSISLLIALAVWVLCLILHKQKKPEVYLRHIVRSLISGSIPGYSTFGIVVLFIIYTNWLSNFLADGSFYKALSSLLFTLGLIPLYALSIEPKMGAKTERSPKKILISALSAPSDETSFKVLKEAFDKGEVGLIELNKEKKHNWIPFLRLYLFHRDTLEKWFILVSKKSQEEKFKEIVGEWEKIKTYEADFDDYNDISSKLYKILKDIRREGYNDEDVSVYISGGTSAITLALTLFAVKDGRQVEYIRQDNGEIEAIEISFEDLYSFSPEER